MKICTSCKQSKPLSDYYKNSGKCRACTLAKYHANKVLKGYPTYEPKSLPIECTCKSCGKTLPISEFYVSKPSPNRKSPKISNKCKACTKLDYVANRESILARAAAKRVPKPKPPKKTKEETQARHAAYKRNLRRTNPLYRLRSNVGTLIANVLSNQGYRKSSKSASILGCTFEEFEHHIESSFTLGMSWNNRTEWHIDHIVPVAFAENEQELLMLNHYTNLRPLWITHNLNKASTLTEDSINHPVYKTIVANRICG
jgi:hypothetical protein